VFCQLKTIILRRFSYEIIVEFMPILIHVSLISSCVGERKNFTLKVAYPYLNDTFRNLKLLSTMRLMYNEMTSQSPKNSKQYWRISMKHQYVIMVHPSYTPISNRGTSNFSTILRQSFMTFNNRIKIPSPKLSQASKQIFLGYLRNSSI